MAVTPIEIFRPQASGILPMLAAPTSVLAQALQNSIQLGRDLANNASAQERDFLREQRSEIALDQRRAENDLAQANNERNFAYQAATDDRNFTRRLFENDRDYDLRVASTNRAAAMDAARMDREERRFEFDVNAAQDRRDALTREREFNREILSSSNADPVSLEGVPIIGGVVPEVRADAESRAANADLRISAAKELQNADALTRATEDKAAAEAELDATGGRVPGLSPAEQRQQEQFNYRKERDTKADERTAAEDAAKDAEQRLSSLASDPDAFPSNMSYLEAEKKSLVEGGMTPDAADTKLKQEALAVTAADSADAKAGARLQRERNAALRMTEEEFVKAVLRTGKDGKPIGEVPEAVAKKRRSFYRLANRKAVAPAARTGVDADLDSLTEGL